MREHPLDTTIFPNQLRSNATRNFFSAISLGMRSQGTHGDIVPVIVSQVGPAPDQ